MIMNKQDALSSSRRRENSQENLHANSIGCMSGLFHFVFNRRHRRRLLTSGKKQEKKREGSRGVTSSSEERDDAMGRESCETVAAAETEEKRKKLLEALGKCDEDLKALKKMIDFVNTNNQLLQLQPPTPLSALSHTFGGGIQQQIMKQKQKKKPGEDEIMMSNISLVERSKRDDYNVGRIHQAKPILWISKAMIESVNEVCRDISWGERREIGRIGLALQDFICRDLIEEFVEELGGGGGGCYSSSSSSSSCCMYSLPFDACKRSLVF